MIKTVNMVKKNSDKKKTINQQEFINDDADVICDISEKKKKAPTSERIKSFIIDLLIFALVWFFLRYIAWTPVRCYVWGTLSFTENYISELKERRGGDAFIREIQKKYDQKIKNEQRIYERKISLIEYLIQLLLDYPFMLIIFYLGFFWKTSQATPGQMLCGCFVEHEFYEKLDWSAAFFRAVVFLLSMFFFIGMLYKLIDKKERTFYDLACDTEVFYYEK